MCVCVCKYLNTLLQIRVGVRKVSSPNKHKNVYAVRTESGNIVWAGQHRGRVKYSHNEIRLRPLSPEILLEIAAEKLALGCCRISGEAGSYLEFLSTCEIQELQQKLKSYVC